MFVAGTLGTVIGDYCAHNLHVDDGGAALLLSPMVAACFLIGRNGLLRWLPLYWSTVVAIRAAGTSVGDFISGRHLLGLPLSTLVTGLALVALLAIWREPDSQDDGCRLASQDDCAASAACAARRFNSSRSRSFPASPAAASRASRASA